MVSIISLLSHLEMQYSTQFHGRRPYGVGMLIAGCDVSSYEHLKDCYMSLLLFTCRVKVLICTRLAHHPTIMTVRQWLLELDHR